MYGRKEKKQRKPEEIIRTIGNGNENGFLVKVVNMEEKVKKHK